MDKNKINNFAYKSGTFIAMVIIGCLTTLICSVLIAITVACLRWMF